MKNFFIIFLIMLLLECDSTKNFKIKALNAEKQYLNEKIELMLKTPVSNSPCDSIKIALLKKLDNQKQLTNNYFKIIRLLVDSLNRYDSLRDLSTMKTLNIINNDVEAYIQKVKLKRRW